VTDCVIDYATHANYVKLSLRHKRRVVSLVNDSYQGYKFTLRGYAFRFASSLGSVGRSPGSKRGVVVGFSRRSRSRLLQKISLIRRDVGLPMFVTLTYHEDYPGEVVNASSSSKKGG